MTLSQKAKTLIDALPTWKHYAIHDTINGKEVKVLRCDKYSDYALTVEVVWKSDVKKLVDTLLSVHQQEIDKMRADCKEKSEGYAKVCARLHEHIIDLDLERGEQKQKLQQFEEFLVAWTENDMNGYIYDYGKKNAHYYPSQDLDLVLDFFFGLRELLE